MNIISDNSMKIVHYIADESMKQEQTRSALVLDKSKNLIKYISTTIGLVNTVLVFLLDKEYIQKEQLFSTILWIDIPLLISLFLSVIAQIMFKGLYYPSGITVLKDMENANSVSEISFEIYRLKCIEAYTNQLCIANDSRAKYVKYAYIAYIIGIFFIMALGLVIIYKN